MTTPADTAATSSATSRPSLENTVHWLRGVVFDEDKSQVRTRNTPAVPAGVRDLIRGALKRAGYVNTAAGRRAHIDRLSVLTWQTPGPCIQPRRGISIAGHRSMTMSRPAARVRS